MKVMIKRKVFENTKYRYVKLNRQVHWVKQKYGRMDRRMGFYVPTARRNPYK